jgi:hypothetical protein
MGTGGQATDSRRPFNLAGNTSFNNYRTYSMWRSDRGRSLAVTSCYPKYFIVPGQGRRKSSTLHENISASDGVEVITAVTMRERSSEL